jgi:TolB-like protein/Tfp pilus assembly protein PilF
LSFFSELKRRNVFRVAVAYTIVAWLVIQVADLAASNFLAPDWVMKMIITLLALGLPISLVFAWAFELTPDGLRRESETTHEKSTAKSNAGKLDRAIIVVLLLSVIYFSYDKFVSNPNRSATMPESATSQTEALAGPGEVADRSIAVLPFVNMSDDASNEYFSEGLSEELLNLLVKIPELHVAARTSSFSYKGKDVRIAQIGEELNVAFVLEGSVRKAGKQVRITAQLVKADDGFHLWSQTYDRTLDDIFVVQDEIAAAVVEALRISLLGAMPVLNQTDPEVYSLYLQGNYFNNLRGEDNLKKAELAFEQALAIDPEYAPAWLGISMNYSIQARRRMLPQEQGAAMALEAVERALVLDENLAAAWASLAYLKRSYWWDWQGAEVAISKALELEPNNPNVVGVAASITNTLGRLSEAGELYEQSYRLDPLRLSNMRALGINNMGRGRFDKAIKTLDRLVALNPADEQGRLYLSLAYMMKGDTDQALIEAKMIPIGVARTFSMAQIYFAMGDKEKAQEYIDDFLAIYANDYPVSIAAIYSWCRDFDSAFEWMEIAFEQRREGVVYVLSAPTLTFLKGDPRFPDFVEKVGLLEAWQAMPPEFGGPAVSGN